MRSLTSAEIDKLILNTATSFSDTCTVDIKSITRNGFGEEIATYTSGSQISCGFELVGGDETPKQQLIVLKTKGKFRLPITTTISAEDRITLKKRYDKTVSYVFDVISEPVKNLDCIVCEAECVGV